jgi:hypothetical protein
LGRTVLSVGYGKQRGKQRGRLDIGHDWRTGGAGRSGAILLVGVQACNLLEANVELSGGAKRILRIYQKRFHFTIILLNLSDP